MYETKTIQGRNIGQEEIEQIRNLMDAHADWGRTRISQEICKLWSWRASNGQLKDMACRSMLYKLEKAGEIVLPPPRRPSNNGIRNRKAPDIAHGTDPIEGKLRTIAPLSISMVEPGCDEIKLFNCLLQKYHYLGHRSTVGETIRYLVKDRTGRPVSCVLFGAAAWSTRARDAHIGWTKSQREQRLQWVTNNTRFLILPWVRVPNLASHILSRVAQRVRPDWEQRYGHPIAAIETFVDLSRFKGTCYQAANWHQLGRTTGRTRNGQSTDPRKSIKAVYLYPLTTQWRSELCSPPADKS